MAAPTTAVVTGAVAGGVASTVTVFMGAQVDALVIGLVAAILVSIHIDKIDSKVKAGAAVLYSSALAGYGSPAAHAFLIGVVPSIAEAESLRLLVALVIGGCAPSIVPLALRAFAGRVERSDQ